ncbi:MAG: UvrB/UvrC motif-containing protein [Thermoanaerobaculales bacterium]
MVKPVPGREHRDDEQGSSGSDSPAHHSGAGRFASHLVESYHREYGIGPRTIIEHIASPSLQLSNLDYHDATTVLPRVAEVGVADPASLAKALGELEEQIKSAAKKLEFDEAAHLRDRIKELRAQQIYKT